MQDATRGAVRQSHTTGFVGSIYEKLLGDVLSGRFPPGSRLPPERDLAEQMGTNRNTLREALRRLEQAKLLRARQGQGVTVLDFRRGGSLELLGPYFEHCPDAVEKAHVVLDLLAPRRMVVAHLAGVAAERANDHDIETLRIAGNEALAAEAAGDALALCAANRRWLNSLVDASHSVSARWLANPMLAAERELLDRHPSLFMVSPSLSQFVLAVAQAIANRDKQGAQDLTHAYYLGIDAGLQELLRPLTHRPLTHQPAPDSEAVHQNAAEAPHPPVTPRARARARARTYHAQA